MENLKVYLKRLAEENCREHQLDNFPRADVNYYEEYVKTTQNLSKHLFPQIVAAAAANGAGFLNDHGAAHVEMVIQRASILLGSHRNQLSGFELFILLLAINLHDVGNVFGREGHEKSINAAVEDRFLSSVIDRPLKRIIVDIASAHGGKTGDGSKDRLGVLERETSVNGLSVRPALIAAILRFADEIADDNTRTSDTLSKIGAIPRGNEIYHKYSSVLQPVHISGRTLEFKFELQRDDVENTYGKDDEDVYLYDEILLRMRKCYCELIYCAQYAEGLLSYSSINVDVRIFENNDGGELCRVPFRMDIGGYPLGILTRCVTELPGKKPTCQNAQELTNLLHSRESSHV